MVDHLHKNVLGSLGIIDTLNLDEAGGGVGGVTRALVAQVTSPNSSMLAIRFPRFTSSRRGGFGWDSSASGDDEKLTRVLAVGYSEAGWRCGIYSLDVNYGRHVSELSLRECPCVHGGSRDHHGRCRDEGDNSRRWPASEGIVTDYVASALLTNPRV